MLTMWRNGLLKSRRKVLQPMAAAVGLWLAASSSSYAALPAVAPPPGAAQAGTDWLLWVRSGLDEVSTILGLAVAAVGMIMVVWKCFKAYQEVGQGRGDWGDVASAATGGALVMMIGAGVLTVAAAVF